MDDITYDTGTNFSLSTLKSVVKSETDKRVSDDSAKELGQEIEGFGVEVSRKAITIAHNEGRKTVRKEDIRQALQEVDK